MKASLMRDDDLYSLLGERISLRRRSLKKTQRDLADAVGMSRASVANIECGRQKVLVHHLYRLAEALQMPNVADLLPQALTAGKTTDAPLDVEFSGARLSPESKAAMSRIISNAMLTKRTGTPRP